jgi:hypothetical protein
MVKQKRLVNKRAEGLSMNTVVIAGIALFVLVIVIMIFSDKIGKVSSGFEDTRDSYKICRTDPLSGNKCATTCGSGWEEFEGYRCEGDDEICCKRKS